MNTARSLFRRLFRKGGTETDPVAPGQERRRSKRHRVELPARFRVLLRSSPEISTTMMPAQLFDISEHGAGLLIETMQFDGFHITRIDSRMSEECLFEIEIPYGFEPIRVLARLIWYIQTPDYPPYLLRLGLAFQEPGFETRRKLRSYIHICEHANEMEERG